MCGRFTITIDLEEIKRHFKIGQVEGEYEPLYNAAPSQDIPVVLEEKPRLLTFFRWGLVPSWAKDPAIGNRLINARAETLKEKPSFREALFKRRCLIVADGFYEWRKEGGKKQPYRFILQSGEPFAMAGLWERWISPSNQVLYSCTIITTEANELVSRLHSRMPVILDEKAQDLWLSGAASKTDHQWLEALKPYPSSELTCYPVSTDVNSPGNNQPDLIMPLRN